MDNDFSPMFELTVGTPLQIDIEDSLQHLNARMVGWVPGRLSIVQPLVVDDLPFEPSKSELKESLVSKILHVRYINQGHIHVFRSSVVKCIGDPVLLLLLTCPTDVQRIEMRPQIRNACLIPMHIRVQDRVIAGLVVDISPKGCGCVLEDVSHQARILKKSTPSLNVTLFIPGQEDGVVISVNIKHINESDGRLYFGLAFSDSEATLPLLQLLYESRILLPEG